MTREQIQSVRRLCHSLARLIDRAFDGGNDGVLEGRFVVDVFGSVSWGGQTGSSGDLDMCIRVSLSYSSLLWLRTEYRSG